MVWKVVAILSRPQCLKQNVANVPVMAYACVTPDDLFYALYLNIQKTWYEKLEYNILIEIQAISNRDLLIWNIQHAHPLSMFWILFISLEHIDILIFSCLWSCDRISIC